MDDTTIENVLAELRSIATEFEYEIDRIVVYGSRVREDFDVESDVDLVVVSPDFEGVNFYARAEDFYWEWDPDLPKPDMILLTPEEYAERVEDPTDIVHKAVETGVEYPAAPA